MNLYVLPASDTGLEDRIFAAPSKVVRGGVSNMHFWHRLRLACEKRGLKIHTSDLWEPGVRGDVLLVQNHPGETFLWRLFYWLKHWTAGGGFVLRRRRWFFEHSKSFSRRVLWQGESPMVVPYIYHHLEALWRSGIYQKIFLLSRRGPAYRYFNYFEYRDDTIVHPGFGRAKDKFLVMVNTNARPHSLRNELYGERLKAIRYFAETPGFDLYGYEWDKAPKHPLYFHYGRFVRRVWRGTTPDKVGAMARYKFSLVFENCPYPGYVSEKIFDAMAAGSIPIYLGAPDITLLVPENCFIDFRKFKSYPELHAFLNKLSENDLARYRENIKNFLLGPTHRRTFDEFIDDLVGAGRTSSA